MPSKSAKQAKFMRAVAHGWKPDRGSAPPVSVAKEFMRADQKRGKYQEGGEVDYETAPGEYTPPTVEDVEPALEQLLSDMGAQRKLQESEIIDYAWDKSKPQAFEGGDSNFAPNALVAQMGGPTENDFERLAGMSGAEQIEYIRPRIIRAMGTMKNIGQSKFGKRYSIIDYGRSQKAVNLWRDAWSKALQKQARESDSNEGMYEGGLAPMNRVEEGKGGLGGLGATVQSFQEGGWVPPRGWRYGTAPLSFEEARKLSGKGGIANFIAPLTALQDAGWTQVPGHGNDLNSSMWYPPHQTILGDDTGAPPGPVTPPETTLRPPEFYGSRDIPLNGGRRGRNGGRGRRPPVPPGDAVPPRVIPPNVVPPGRVPPGGDLVPPVDYTPPDRRAGRDTAMSEALREHRKRVAALLNVPPGIAEGGAVKGYQEGGEVLQPRPGHGEDTGPRGPNPYPPDSARYRLWERKYHSDEPIEPPVEEVPRESLTERVERLRDKTKDYLEEEGQAAGGFINAPMGGVPPRVQPAEPEPQPMMMQSGGLAQVMRGAPQKSTPLQMPPGRMPWRGAPPPRVQGGMPPRGMGKPMPPWARGRGPMAPPIKGGPRIAPPPGKMPPTGGGEIEGGPRVPPNLRGYLQRERMMNRPRRGMPGPAGAGGAPQNRVGQSDQQGGLSRALQRGTGRPPMSRRQGFYR